MKSGYRCDVQSRNKVHQLSVTVDDVVFDLVRCDLREELAGTVDLGVFDFSQLHRRHRTLGFFGEVDVFDLTFHERYCPVGVGQLFALNFCSALASDFVDCYKRRKRSLRLILYLRQPQFRYIAC